MIELVIQGICFPSSLSKYSSHCLSGLFDVNRSVTEEVKMLQVAIFLHQYQEFWQVLSEELWIIFPTSHHRPAHHVYGSGITPLLIVQV